MFEINPLCCRLKLPERKARRRSVSVSLLSCSGRITQIQVCGILFGIMRTEAFFYHLYIIHMGGLGDQSF